MKCLLFNDDLKKSLKEQGLVDESIETLESTYSDAERIYQSLHKLDPYNYAYVYLRMKHDIENREIIGNVINMIERAIFYEPNEEA